MTADVSSAPLSKGDFTKTTLSIGWLLSTLLAVQTDNLSSELPPKIRQLHYPASRSHIPAPLRHAVKHPCIETAKSYLCKVLHFNRQNLMLINSRNDWAMAVIDNISH